MNRACADREAFRGFDPAAIVALTPDDLDALTKDTRLIRNRRKIEAIVHNARGMLEREKAHGSPSTLRQGSVHAGSGQGFRAYLRSHRAGPGGGFEGTVADLCKRFKFLGDTGCYHFLWVVNEDVPRLGATGAPPAQTGARYARLRPGSPATRVCVQARPHAPDRLTAARRSCAAA